MVSILPRSQLRCTTGVSDTDSKICGCSSVVEHSSDKGKADGSIPSSRTSESQIYYGASKRKVEGLARQLKGPRVGARRREMGSQNFSVEKYS